MGNTLQKYMMEPDLCSIFCEEYVKQTNEMRLRQSAKIARHEKELKKLDRQEDRIINCIKEGGFDMNRLKDEYKCIENRREELKAQLAAMEEPPVLFHPSMGKKYKKEIKQLVAALNNKEDKQEASELIRRLVEKIVLTPNEEGTGLKVDVLGDLAGIIDIALNGKTSHTSRDVSLGFLEVVDLEEETSNQVFEVLKDWEDQLKQANIDFDEPQP